MAKSLHNDVFDAALNYIKNNAQRQIACSAEPTTYAQANATYALADVAMAAGDFTVADGDVSGRKVTVGAKSGALIDASGSATHIALVDDTNSKLLEVTTCTTQALTANGSNTVSFPSWKTTIADPT